MPGPDSISSGPSHPLDTAGESPDSQPESPTLEIAPIPYRDKGKGKAVDQEPSESESETEPPLETEPKTEVEAKETDWELEFAIQQSLLDQQGKTAEEYLGFHGTEETQEPETGGQSSSSAARAVRFESAKRDALIIQGTVIRQNASSAPPTTGSTSPTPPNPPTQPAKAASNSRSWFARTGRSNNSTPAAAKTASSISKAGSLLRNALTKAAAIRETPEARQEREQYAANKRLRIAVFDGVAESITNLIGHGDPATKSKQDGWNAVHVAVLSKKPNLATLLQLIERSNKLSGSDTQTAAQKLLLEKDNRGNTPLHLASFARGAATRTGDEQRKAALDDLIDQMKQLARSAESAKNNNNETPGIMGGRGNREPNHPDGVLDPENL